MRTVALIVILALAGASVVPGQPVFLQEGQAAPEKGTFYGRKAGERLREKLAGLKRLRLALAKGDAATEKEKSEIAKLREALKKSRAAFEKERELKEAHQENAGIQRERAESRERENTILKVIGVIKLFF